MFFHQKFGDHRVSRKRVSKGQIIQKKDEKVINVLLTLQPSVSADNFVEKFKEVYPDDWKRVIKRFNEHERLTKDGKSHPMAHPHQYMLNASKKIREQYANGKDLNELLIEINTPKPKFTEETPPKLEQWIKQLQDRSSYENRIDAINKLGKFKCNEVIEAFMTAMDSDLVNKVRDTAFQRLVRFGVDVTKPKKAKVYADPELTQKLIEVADSLKVGFAYERFESRFRSKFPEEFDLQKYTKKNRFKSWLKKQMAQLPKT
nr:HEAT repeat domain-containing protein [Vibrio cyclitrophicus]